MERDELRRADALDSYWDDVVLGERPADAERPNGELADLVERLRSSGEPPDARRARERVWRELQGHPRWRDPRLNGHFSAQRMAGEPWPVTSLDDRRADGVAPDHRRSQVTSPRWPLAQLATAALLLLSMVAGLLLLRVVRPGWVAPPSEPLVETLLDQTVEVDGAPGNWVPIMVERWTFAPGPATLTAPPLDGPQWVAADGGALVATVDGVEQELASGQSLVVEPGQELTLRNAGAGEAAAIRCYASVGFVHEDYDRGAIAQQIVLDTVASKALPAGTASRVVFVRLSLPPGSALPPGQTGALDWFGVLAGRLGLTLTGDKLPVGWKSGAEQEIAAFERLPRLVPGTGVTLRNIGDQPLVVLRLTVLPVDQVTGESDEAAAAPARDIVARGAVAGGAAAPGRRMALGRRRPRRPRRSGAEVADGPG